MEQTAAQIYQEKLDSGASKKDINAWFAENQLEVPGQFRETSMTDILRAAGGQGFLFGFGDELEAMARSGQFSGPEYEQHRDKIRSELQTWQNDHKGSSLAMELAGGMLSGGPLAGLGKAIGKKFMQKASPSLLQAIGLGAAEGALVGAGQAPEMSDIPMSAAKGAALSGAASGVLSKGADYVRNMSPERAAKMKVAEGLRNAGVDPNNLDGVIPNGGVIADIPGMDQTFRGAAGNYGPGRTVAKEAMRERLAAMPERIIGAGQDVIGDIKTPMQRAAEIAKERAITANKNYGAAMAGTVVPDDGVLSILNTKSGRSAYRNAFDDYNAWHPDDPMEFIDFKDADTVNSLEFWDKVYQRLGDTANKAKRKGAKAALATTTELRSRITNAFDEQTDGLYKTGRDEFKKLIRQEQAIGYGKDIIKKRDLHPKDVEDYIGGLDEFERREVLRGALGELEVVAGESVEGANAARKVLRKPTTIRKLMAAFPDKAEGAEFIEEIRDLSRQSALATDLLSGSRTAPMLAEQEAARGMLGSAVGGMVTGDPSGAVVGAGIGAMKNRATQLGQKTTENMVDMMLSSDSQTLQDIFAQQNPGMWRSMLNAPGTAAAGYNALTQ